MAGVAISGSWKASALPGQAGSAQWGTGINPIHGFYQAGPPLRSMGRLPGPDSPTAVLDDVEPSITAEDQLGEWGYTPEDMPPSEFYRYTDNHPNLNEDSPRKTGYTDDFPSWNEPGDYFRAISYGSETERHYPGEFPTETVSEGWLNKATTTELDARTSDPSQYEMQTSMAQRNQQRNNAAATVRETDDPREPIDSRHTAMKLKEWSRGEREIDMFPFQQSAQMERTTGHYSRTAGTGYADDMLPNEMYVNDPIERTTPADPYLGGQETALDTGTDQPNPEDYSWNYYG